MNEIKNRGVKKITNLINERILSNSNIIQRSDDYIEGSDVCSSYQKNGKCKDTGKYCDACAYEYTHKKED